MDPLRQGWNLMFFNNSSAVLGEFSKSPKYPKILKFLEIRQIIIEFKWIDFCNLLGRVCKHSLLKSSSNTPRKWNDYITSAGPLVGNRCWIQPAGRAKACETNGWHHSCLSDVFSEKHLGKLDCIILISGQSLRIWWSDSKSLKSPPNFLDEPKRVGIVSSTFNRTLHGGPKCFQRTSVAIEGCQNSCEVHIFPAPGWRFSSLQQMFFSFPILQSWKNRKGTYIAGMLKLRFQKIRVTAGTVFVFITQ